MYKSDLPDPKDAACRVCGHNNKVTSHDRIYRAPDGRAVRVVVCQTCYMRSPRIPTQDEAPELYV